MFDAIAICRSQVLDIPLLVLTYTALDALAWAVYGDAMADVKDRFVKFCNDHVLLDDKILCAALDLYAARCAMLHSLGWESRLSEKGHAKAITYSFGPGQSQAIRFLEQKDPGRFVSVNGDDLVSALRSAYERIRELARSDPALLQRLQQAEGKQLAGITPGLARMMAEHPDGPPQGARNVQRSGGSLYSASISFRM
ncbi:hypothetical protein [Variovorax sp. M-6]|uniref:hypothetical protein n=1 Tax=Variovorax sp. M-6 TaxID=3233041 RepID=UPI003F9CB664